MADGSDLEKTEPASPRRLEQAREEGEVPRSRELATCTLLLAAGAGIWFLGDGLIRQLSRQLTSALSFERSQVFDSAMLPAQLVASLGEALISFAPLAGLLVGVALASPLLIGGWLFSAKALQPKFGRMNPVSGLANMVSSRAAVELAKALGKALLVGSVAWVVVSSQIEAVLGLALEPLNASSGHLARLLLASFLSITAALVLVAMLDVPYQMWQHANKLKMTKQEVRQESKESDGNPEIKAKIRAQQREMARRRMMSEVSGADVVVTNPTHYAVALKYSENAMRAPKVVAKGADAVAARIRDIAADARVPVLESPALARALFRHAELGDEIPQALYTAVAEILAYVFQLKVAGGGGGTGPQRPPAVHVPPELDPLQAAAPAGTGPRP